MLETQEQDLVPGNENEHIFHTDIMYLYMNMYIPIYVYTCGIITRLILRKRKEGKE